MPPMDKLHVIITSTRPGRVGLPVGRWFADFARQHGKFEVRVVDLAEVNLPFLDEPEHPRLKKYSHDHTKRWSEIVESADAYVAVTPEYNYGPPATLINAFDFVYLEWNYKPIGFVSYGGVSGGTRSVQVSKQIATTLKMMPMVEAVSIPFVGKTITDGTFTGGEAQAASATALLDELARWSTALKPLRSPAT